MSTMGCCGRRTALGLLAEADAFPPSHPRGAKARRQIAYSVVAYKARQDGNRVAYERAMRGLADLGLFSSSDTALTARASTAVTATVTRAATGPSLAQVGTTVAAVVNMLASLASIATSIAQAAGGDATAVAAANTIVSWVRAIVNGTPPTIPTLDANTLNGFMKFCSIGTPFKTAIDLGFSTAIAVFSGNIAAAGIAGRAPSASDTQAVSVLTSIQQRLDGLFDGLCAAVGSQAVTATQTCPDGTVVPATSPCALPPPPPAAPRTVSRVCWNGQPTSQTWNATSNRWDPPSPPCPPQPQAAGLPAGGCASGFNVIAPAGVLLSNGALLPGTAGRTSCAPCYAPGRFIPGTVSPQGTWMTSPGCLVDGRISNVIPPYYTCPTGTKRAANGDCTTGGSGGGSSLLFIGAAALAAKYFLF